MSGGARGVKKTIQHIKEITGNNYSEDEIYAMLEECNMDPNETTQNLLAQDPFHEVRRKRDRKKENNIKESTEPKWKPGMQGRGNRGGRGNYSARHSSQGSSKNVLSAKDNEINKGAGDGVILPAQDKRNKEILVASSSNKSEISTATASDTIIAPIPFSHWRSKEKAGPKDPRQKENNSKMKSSTEPKWKAWDAGGRGNISSNKSEISTATASDKLEGLLPKVSSEANKITTPALSASDPILMPSQDSRPSVGTISREVGTRRTPVVEQSQETPAEITTASGLEVGSSFVQGKVLYGEENKLVSESSRPAPSSNVSSPRSRPSSSYNNRPQQAIGPQKVAPGKEWKPKPTTLVPAQELGTEVPVIPAEVHSSSKPRSSIPESKERKVEKSHISDGQHVIIPDHLHVAEVEKLGFQFGSFDASFGFNSSSLNGPTSDKIPSLSEASEEIAEHVEEQTTRNQDVLVTVEDGHDSDRPPSSTSVPQNLSPEGDVSSNVAPEHVEPKHETSLPIPSHPFPVVHSSANMNFGFIPPIIGSHVAPFETNDSRAPDSSRVPSFAVQQPFDPAGYYPQFYRSGADTDGRISPFHPSMVATKYNGNVPVASQQASQSSQEVGNPILLSAAGPTPLSTQAGGLMQTPIAVSQQQVPVFRQPTGLHLPHYPPNFIPYGPYFSPFYLPPPAIHQFLSNGAFPQQPQPGGMFPAPPVATPKYPHPQYKPGGNPTNSPHIGIPGTYGPYGSSPTGYNQNPAVTAGNSTSNEDLGGSQFKDSNGYVTGQQSEGPGVWIAAPGRDITGLHYNLPHGGQVAYAPTQAAHGNFAGMYHHHPAQPVTTGPIHPLLQQPQSMAGVDMVGPASSMYQQQQPPQPAAQLNWPNNY
ncbi:GBF-interacting protein 1-like protein isoform X1 [Tanacetum coccineum]